MNSFSQEIQPIIPNLPSITEAKAIEILNSMPSFDNLSEEARKQILKIAAADEYKRSLQYKAKIAKLNYEDIKATFLNNTKSSHTKEAYSLALRRLEMYLSFQGKSFAEVSTLDADKLIQSDFLTKPLIKDSLNTSAPARASASIRRDSSCLGAFYAFVQRISNNEFGNPFRGTRAKPTLKAQRELSVPTKEEVATILSSKEIPKPLRAAIAIMAYRGIRVGALPTLTIDYTNNSSFTAFSKGKPYNGHFDEKETLLPLAKFLTVFQGKKKPFYGMTAPQIKMQVSYWLGKLFKAGSIANKYSCHDFRHFFAVSQYRGDFENSHKGDIYILKQLLNHSGISITEGYLKTLNLI